MTNIVARENLEAARIAGEIAGRTGGVWTVNPATSTYIVAASTHPNDMTKANRYATIKVNK